MNYKEHRKKWNDCQACPLCLTRKFVVLGKGNIPCDILMIGEAPGASEDISGSPFSGPAGQLLDKIVTKAKRGRDVKFAYTNLVACIPLGVGGKKTAEPSLESIDACSQRLDEFYVLSQPKAIICVGKLAREHMEGYNDRMMPFVEIVHPAAILRADLSQRGLMVQNCVVTISDVIEELGL